MTLFRQPSEWGAPEREQATNAGTHFKIVRGAPRRIGRGSLACPACDLPILVASTLPISARVECPFCRHESPARQFLRLDSSDTPGNDVELIARLPA